MSNADPPPLKILVADDNPRWLQVMKRAMEKEGYDALLYNPAKPSPDVLTQPFDLAILDVRFEGDADGFALADQLRKNRPRLPIMFLTGYSEKTYAKRAAEMGCHFVVKTPHWRVLVAHTIFTLIKARVENEESGLTQLGIDIHHYEDYRKFLSDLYKLKKAQNPRFSYQMMARLMGFKSKAAVYGVTNGSFHLSPASAHLAAQKLGLNKRETARFYALVIQNQARE